MESMEIELLNTKFAQLLENGTADEKLQAIEETRSYLKDRLREEEFTGKIIQPVPITEAEVEVDVQEDVFFKIVPIEPESWALPINFTGAAPDHYATGKRYKITFAPITTPMYQKTEDELKATKMPFIKVIENNSVFDIQEVVDKKFLEYCNIAVGFRPGASVSSVNKKFQSEDLTSLLQTISNQKGMVPETILMTESTRSEIAAWGSKEFDVGAKEITINGYTYEVLGGKRLITTTKTNIVAPNEVYVFAGAQYLGNYYIIGDIQFFIEKRARIFSWQTWKTIGLGIGNIKGVGKLTYNEDIS